MAIADYNTLIAEVKAWCARSDSVFSARLPTIVLLAEERIYHGHGEPGDQLYTPPLRVKAMETTATMALVSGVGNMPDDSLGIRRVTRADDDFGLTAIDPTRYVKEIASAGGQAGVPVFYTVEGDSLKTAPAWTGNLSLLYYARDSAVTPDNQTSDVLTAHGLVYFNACMFEAMTFMQDVELAAGWLAKYRTMVMGLNQTAMANRLAGARMSMGIRAIG